ncbi:unnamed protein product [Ectocarpus fasciculatus]
MIINRDIGFFSLLFSCEGSIVIPISGKILGGIVAGFVASIMSYYEHPLQYDFTVFTVFGVALSLFLGFRNKACYDRWWEGRKQWGAYVIAVRNLGRMLNTVAKDSPETTQILHLISAHAHALRHQLRGDKSAVAIRDRLLPPDSAGAIITSRNPADALLNEASLCLGRLHASGDIDSIQQLGIHNHISEIGFVQGACERIQTTPLPFPYVLLVHRTVVAYILLTPFALVQTCGWFTPLLMGIISYFFFGLEEISSQLMMPFTTSVHALSLEALCRTIDISINMALGEPQEEPLKPHGSVLM